ncbi:MAG: phosphoglycolate phosphatase [Hyphomicrobiaceae bacterium]|nr:phosphoglycolate phosphatase [Hyphomicrobiaceae bacterium]
MGLVVFDLDGTLIDTAPDLAFAMNRVLSEEGLAEIALAEARVFVGHGARAMIERGLVKAGSAFDEARARALTRRFIEIYTAHIADESRPFPGALAALDRLEAAGHRLAICTNKREELARTLFDALGLTQRFAAIVGGNTVGVPKPDPAPLLETIRLAGGGPAIMVGDSATDVGAARNAKIPVIGVPFGYTDTPIAELAPDRIVDHFDALPDAVDALFQETAPLA